MLRFCPHCGQDSFTFDGEKRYTCSHCDFCFFFNSATAVGAIVIKDDSLLIAVRGRDPEKGKYDFPGGFVDPGETADQALCRELQEELGVRPATYEYFVSASNRYLYGGLEYSICDIFFRCTLEDYTSMRANDDVAELKWIPLDQLEIADFAFISAKPVLAKLLD